MWDILSFEEKHEWIIEITKNSFVFIDKILSQNQNTCVCPICHAVCHILLKDEVQILKFKLATEKKRFFGSPEHFEKVDILLS